MPPFDLCLLLIENPAEVSIYPPQVTSSEAKAALVCQLSHKPIGFAPMPTSYLISLHIFTGINRFYITANRVHRKVGRSYIMLILLWRR